MNTQIIQLWKNNTITEAVTSPTIKRGDTSPNFGVRLLTNGDPFSLIGVTATARVRFYLTLKQFIGKQTTTFRVSKSSHLKIGDVMLVGTEKMLVKSIDTNDLGYLRVTVTRGHSGTAKAEHEVDSTVSVNFVERSATRSDAIDNNEFYLSWQPGDTSRIGDFQLEFECLDSNGGKFSVPSSPIIITVVDDFNGG